MHNHWRSILLLICLTILLSAPFAVNTFSQTVTDKSSSPCKIVPKGSSNNRNKSVKLIKRIDEYMDGQTMTFKSDKPFLFATYKFDRQQRMVEKNHYRSDGVALPKTTFEYDKNNRLIKENVFSGITQKPYLETKYVYNEDGTLKEEIGLNIEDSHILSKKVYSYDLKKNYFEFTESVSNSEKLNRIGFTISNDDCGNSETFYYQPDGKLDRKDVYSYDDKNNLIFVTAYSADNKVIGKSKYEYKFDTHANWIKRSIFKWKEDGKLDWEIIDIAHQKIKYFDTK